MLIGFLGFTFMFCALMVNIYWYIIKDILKKNGFKTYLFIHFDDLGNFQHLINNTLDVQLKNNYKKIMFRLRLSIGLSILPIIGIVLWMEFCYAKW